MPAPPAPKGPSPRRARQAAIHAELPADGVPGGFAGQLVVFCEELRGEGVAVGTSELLDATTALGAIGWSDRENVRETLAATLAKSPKDRHVFGLVFDRFFFRAAEAEALRRDTTDEQACARDAAGEAGEDSDGVGRIGGGDADDAEGSEPDFDAVRDAIATAIARGADSRMADLAFLAIRVVRGRVDESGVLDVDVHRIRRALDLRPEPNAELADDDPRRNGLPRAGIRAFEAHLRRALEQRRIAQLGELPAARPLNEMDRTLPTTADDGLADIHRVVQQLKRRLNSQGQELRGRRRRTHVDLRATMRASLQTGGVPVVVKERAVRPRRPELFVLCDVSPSVSRSSMFFLSVLHALHDAFRQMRSFVFVERISEVTEVFEREKEFEHVAEAITRDAGVADLTGTTDYGRVWHEFLDQTKGELTPRSTLIVLGDARTNGRDPAVGAFAQITQRVGRTFWLNPEPRPSWDHVESMIDRYAPYCEVHECWTTDHLEAFVTALTSSAPLAPRPGPPD